jgi:PTS system ascorbate-specific IIB component
MIIATLCGMGFGTSMLLKLTIDEILKQEEIIGYKVVPWDLGSFKGQNADIVVAPTDMESHLKNTSAKVILVKNLVDKSEIREKILAAINSLEE